EKINPNRSRFFGGGTRADENDAGDGNNVDDLPSEDEPLDESLDRIASHAGGRENENEPLGGPRGPQPVLGEAGRRARRVRVPAREPREDEGVPRGPPGGREAARGRLNRSRWPRGVRVRQER
ncbi:hypothetical protein THAOC_36366, partial [Thalassiosira oceanica]